MMTGEKLSMELVDELIELGLPNMAASLDSIYHSERFLKTDRLTLIAEMIRSEYQDKVNRRINNRLRHAKLMGCPQDISDCVDSKTREYLPHGIVESLSELSFIEMGCNICILGASDCGKTYLAKAIGIAACRDHKVEYHHCETFIENLVAMKNTDFEKYERKMRLITKLDLLILDDFLINTIMDEREVKILFTILENRCEKGKSTIVCSQREPKSWSTMLLNDEVSANAIMKRVTKHYVVMINTKSE